MVAVSEKIMAKKKTPAGSGDGSRKGRLTRLDPDIAEMAKAVAASRGQYISDYLAGLLRGPVSRDFVAMVEDLKKRGGQS